MSKTRSAHFGKWGGGTNVKQKNSREQEALWAWKDAPIFYPKVQHKDGVREMAERMRDERHISKFLTQWHPNEKKIVIDLGIGSGRELAWLDGHPSISKIIGIDNSDAFLNFLRRNTKQFKTSLVVVKENLLTFRKWRRPRGKLLVFLYLMNSLGNFIARDRSRILSNVRQKMNAGDRFIVVLAKRPENIDLSFLPQLSYKAKRAGENEKLAVLMEYGLEPILWNFSLAKHGELPQFWYDNQTHDVIVHLRGEVVLSSHRWNRQEIAQLFKSAKLIIEKCIEGRMSYIVFARR